MASAARRWPAPAAAESRRTFSSTGGGSGSLARRASTPPGRRGRCGASPRAGRHAVAGRRPDSPAPWPPGDRGGGDEADLLERAGVGPEVLVDDPRVPQQDVEAAVGGKPQV